MDENKQVRTEKNPVGASILSALFPGVGFFYIGNVVKGIAYILIFVCLIVLEVEARGNEHIVFGLLIAGFYIYQIFDSYDEAQKTRGRSQKTAVAAEGVSLFWAYTILVIGIVFQLAELHVIRYRDVARLWPVVLIALGVKYIYNYSKNREETGKTGETEQEGGSDE